MKRVIVIEVDFFHTAMSQRCKLRIEKHHEQYHVVCWTKSDVIYQNNFEKNEEALTFALKYMNQFTI